MWKTEQQDQGLITSVDSKQLQLKGPDMDASPLVYDTTLEDLRNFSSFEKQWLLVPYPLRHLACQFASGRDDPLVDHAMRFRC